MTKDATVRRRWGASAAVAAALLVLPVGVYALQNPEDSAGGKQTDRTAGFHNTSLQVKPSLLRYELGAKAAEGLAEMQGFFSRYSRDWDIQWDERADRPHLIQGAGIPLIPGKGNSLSRKDLGLGAYNELQVADVEPLLRGFMDQYPELFRINQEDLVLDADRTHVSSKGQRYWSIELQQTYRGVPVEDAHVFFRINHGNIVQFGSNRVADVSLDTTPRLNRSRAFRTVLRAAGFRASEVSKHVQRGALKIYPVASEDESVGEPFFGRPGDGYSHRLVWEFKFRRTGDARTYHAIIDAHSGQMLGLLDSNAYATVSGGIFPVTNLDAEVNRPFGFADLSIGGNTDAAGVYNYTSGTVTVTLDGKYFRMSDACGPISLSVTSAPGNINFGTSGGTDCTTPGIGGAGNTHASRSGFYHLTNINRKAASFLSGNGWLASKVTSNMNINNTCNAFWNGSTVNFYRSGGGCSNTGELAAVFLHEWGHGMDTNSGGAASENGTGEAVGDTFAFLETKDPCIGHNFLPGQVCFNCTTCTGVRDVKVFSVNGGALPTGAVIAKPSNVTSNSSINCDRYACPYLQQGIFPYQGPMGYQGHCESHISSSANWDLAQKLIVAHGSAAAGWAVMDAIWYESLTPSKSAYQIASGGQCNASATVNGCGSQNWYTVYLGVDDDDGNLSNGTPNGCHIWDAFTDHGIACGTRPACSGGGGPTPTPTPVVPTATPTNTSPPGPTNTPTRTNTPVPPTNTPTPVPGGSNCASPNAAIPDANTTGVSSSVSPSGSGTLTDLNVSLNITHTWIGDVRATLAHNGTTVAVFDRPGVPGSTYGCSGDNANATLDDAAATSVEGICASGVPTINGTYKPNAVLSAFNGHSLSGTWTLTVSDAVSSDVGRLVSWCIAPTTGSGPTATPVPPTATPVPPTNTPVPPTATPVGPTTTPTPASCGGQTVTGSLTGGGDVDYYPLASGAGTAFNQGLHFGQLTGPTSGSVDFDLYLQRRTTSTASWTNLAQSISGSSAELIAYTNNNTSSTDQFRWRVISWTGSGSYTFCFANP